MTLGNMLSHMGIGQKQLSERYADYAAPSHDQHVFYSYDQSPPSHGPVAYSKHHQGGGGHKNNAAMSALTLLAFLFFLHILQQCLRDHMNAMQTPQIMVMTGGREGEETVAKLASLKKMDKTGNIDESKDEQKGTKNKIPAAVTNVYNDEPEDNFFKKIKTADNSPKIITHRYKNYVNRSSGYAGFVSNLNDDF